MYDIAICDDSPMDRKYLIERIRRNKEYGSLLCFHEYNSGRELLDDMDKVSFGVIFLDVQMKYMDGEETAENIRKVDNDVVLVFYTGYAEPSPHSFEVQPYRYMKKNMSDAEQEKYIADALEKMAAGEKAPILSAKCDGKKLYLKPGDIIYIEKCNKTTRVYLSEQAMKKYGVSCKQEVRIADKLKNLYQILEPYGFGYPHDSYIINFAFLQTCTDKEFTLEGFAHTSFKFARSKAVDFRQQMQRYMGSRYGEIVRR